MKEFWKRLWAETPSFFKRMRIFGVSLSATGTALVAIPGIPPKLSSIAATCIWVGMAIAAVSQLAVSDPTKLQP